jgi:hypothetical protein
MKPRQVVTLQNKFKVNEPKNIVSYLVDVLKNWITACGKSNKDKPKEEMYTEVRKATLAVGGAFL